MVLSREETARVIGLLGGVNQLVVKLLYGSGLSIIECTRLQGQEIDFTMKPIPFEAAKETRTVSPRFRPQSSRC